MGVTCTHEGTIAANVVSPDARRKRRAQVHEQGQQVSHALDETKGARGRPPQAATIPKEGTVCLMSVGQLPAACAARKKRQHGNTRPPKASENFTNIVPNRANALDELAETDPDTSNRHKVPSLFAVFDVPAVQAKSTKTITRTSTAPTTAFDAQNSFDDENSSPLASLMKTSESSTAENSLVRPSADDAFGSQGSKL